MSTQGLGDLDRLISDMGDMPRKAESGIRGVMNRGGLEMKRKWQANFSTSRSFKMIARSVDYDVSAASILGGGNISVEVGPNAATDSSAPLAGIAMFGGSRGGGGTVPEPDSILESEADTAVGYINRLLGELL